MITRFLPLLLFALSLSAQPFSPQDPVFSQINSSLLQGCVGAWRLEEGSGTRYDMSGNNNNLTSNNSVGSAAGKVGNCATFVNSSLQSLSEASTSSLSFTNETFSLTCWVKFTSLVSSSPGLVCKRTGGSIEYQLLYLTTADGGINAFAFFVTDGVGHTGSVNASSFGTPVTGQWYFIYASHLSGSSVTISVNNGTVDSSPYTQGSFNGGGLFNLGRINSAVGSGNYLNGALDEVVVWRRALTFKELTGLYLSGLGTHTPWAHP